MDEQNNIFDQNKEAASAFDQDGTETAEERETAEESVPESPEEEYVKAEAFSGVGQTAPEPQKSWLKEAYEWTQAIAVAVVLALLINQFLFSIVQVDGSSMVPTLHHQERLIVTKAFYKPKQKDIIIVKSAVLGKYIVKRAIALPGQELYIDASSGDVYVDGELQEEPYIREKLRSGGMLYNYPIVIPQKGAVADLDMVRIEAEAFGGASPVSITHQDDGSILVSGSRLVEDGVFVEGQTVYKQDCLFAMGDNRNNSQDSRALGVVPYSEIVGKAAWRILPLSAFGGLYSEMGQEQ